MTYEEEVRERLADIKAHPERHHHDFLGLQRCCVVRGVRDMKLHDAHEKYASVGMNGGQRCDVTSGPCSCGAWH